MRSYQKEILFFIIIAVVGFGAFYACGNLLKSPHHNQIDAHIWLHEQIGITAEQDKQLAAIEKKFAQKQLILREKIHVGNLELAAAMLEEKVFSKRVAASIEGIHRAQGELQKLTIEHIFDMQAVLTAQQAEKLKQLAADALIQNP